MLTFMKIKRNLKNNDDKDISTMIQPLPDLEQSQNQIPDLEQPYGLQAPILESIDRDQIQEQLDIERDKYMYDKSKITKYDKDDLSIQNMNSLQSSILNKTIVAPTWENSDDYNDSHKALSIQQSLRAFNVAISRIVIDEESKKIYKKRETQLGLYNVIKRSLGYGSQPILSNKRDSYYQYLFLTSYGFTSNYYNMVPYRVIQFRNATLALTNHIVKSTRIFKSKLPQIIKANNATSNASETKSSDTKSSETKSNKPKSTNKTANIIKKAFDTMFKDMITSTVVENIIYQFRSLFESILMREDVRLKLGFEVYWTNVNSLQIRDYLNIKTIILDLMFKLTYDNSNFKETSQILISHIMKKIDSGYNNYHLYTSLENIVKSAKLAFKKENDMLMNEMKNMKNIEIGTEIDNIDNNIHYKILIEHINNWFVYYLMDLDAKNIVKFCMNPKDNVFSLQFQSSRVKVLHFLNSIDELINKVQRVQTTYPAIKKKKKMIGKHMNINEKNYVVNILDSTYRSNCKYIIETNNVMTFGTNNNGTGKDVFNTKKYGYTYIHSELPDLQSFKTKKQNNKDTKKKKTKQNKGSDTATANNNSSTAGDDGSDNNNGSKKTDDQ